MASKSLSYYDYYMNKLEEVYNSASSADDILDESINPFRQPDKGQLALYPDYAYRYCRHNGLSHDQAQFAVMHDDFISTVYWQMKMWVRIPMLKHNYISALTMRANSAPTDSR